MVSEVLSILVFTSDLIRILLTAAPKRPIKKEDLDQELDKYMSSSKPAPLY